MPARLTAAQAAALGITTDQPQPKRKRTRRTEPRGNYRSICHDCAEVFTTYAAETRHVNNTHHVRFDTMPEPGAAQ